MLCFLFSRGCMKTTVMKTTEKSFPYQMKICKNVNVSAPLKKHLEGHLGKKSQKVKACVLICFFFVCLQIYFPILYTMLSKMPTDGLYRNMDSN